jgi:adenylate kinase family enzyme
VGVTENKPFKIEIQEFLELVPDDITSNNNYIVNIRGTNGSGKSTFGKALSVVDERAFYLVKGKKTLATVFPTYSWIFLGKYNPKHNGGCDTLDGYEQVIETLLSLYNKPFHILFEGFIVTSSYVKYNKFLRYMKEKGHRKTLVINMLPPLEVCINRVYSRNGGKEFGKDSLIGKYQQTKLSIKNTPDYDIPSIEYDNQHDKLKDVINIMFRLIEENIQ